MTEEKFNQARRMLIAIRGQVEAIEDLEREYLERELKYEANSVPDEMLARHQAEKKAYLEADLARLRREFDAL